MCAIRRLEKKKTNCKTTWQHFKAFFKGSVQASVMNCDEAYCWTSCLSSSDGSEKKKFSTDEIMKITFPFMDSEAVVFQLLGQFFQQLIDPNHWNRYQYPHNKQQKGASVTPLHYCRFLLSYMADKNISVDGIYTYRAPVTVTFFADDFLLLQMYC